MKAIINGKRYDDETAHLVGEATHGEDRTNFSFWLAGLYRTPRSHAYFLAGYGGPMTQFARSDGDALGFGERILPLSDREAREWAERHLTPDEYEREYGATPA